MWNIEPQVLQPSIDFLKSTNVTIMHWTGRLVYSFWEARIRLEPGCSSFGGMCWQPSGSVSLFEYRSPPVDVTPQRDVDPTINEPQLCLSPTVIENIPTARVLLAAERRTPNAERRTPYAVRRTPTADRRPPTADRRPPTAERRTPNAERRTPNAERRTPNAERRTPNAERRTPKKLPNHAPSLALAWT